MTELSVYLDSIYSAGNTMDLWLRYTSSPYGGWPGGGWADMKLCWSGYHASNNTLMSWTAVFHNHHGRAFLGLKLE